MMRRPLLMTGFALVVAIAAGVWWWRTQQVVTYSVVPVAGGDGGGLPRATLADENFDGPALDAAFELARAQQAQAFLVLRHGHLVAESYASGWSGDRRADAGEFAATLFALAVGAARADGRLSDADLEPFMPARILSRLGIADSATYAQWLTQRVWQPLNAGGAELRVQTPRDAPPTNCCFEARIGDWLRVAALLLEEGRFEGNEIVSAAWVQRMRAPQAGETQRGLGLWTASAAKGAEPFAADDVFYLRGPGRWRLWMMPTLQLAVLLVADEDRKAAAEGSWDETRLPNAVIRAVSNHAAGDSGRNLLRQLVPEH